MSFHENNEIIDLWFVSKTLQSIVIFTEKENEDLVMLYVCIKLLYSTILHLWQQLGFIIKYVHLIRPNDFSLPASCMEVSLNSHYP